MTRRGHGIRCVGVLWLLAGIAAPTLGQIAVEPHEMFVCTSGQERRFVRIYSQSGSNGSRLTGSCRVDYTRGATTMTLWTSRTDHAYCLQKALSLVTKLVEGNYTCKPEAVGAPGDGDVADKTPAR